MTKIRTLSPDATYFGREGQPYAPEEALIHAANSALVLGRPLLLTGEPGVGKTDFAFAAARELSERSWPVWPERMTPAQQREFGLLECYVRSDTTARDLLYTYDAVARFGDAYMARGGDAVKVQNAAAYIELRGLGAALASERQRVVLIDELDKAPRDLPNDLLRELDQGAFEIQELQDADEGLVDRNKEPIRRQMGEAHRPVARRPFVIVTSNEERPFPSAFLRRCIYFHVPFPTEDEITEIVASRLRFLAESDAEVPKKKDIAAAVSVFMRLRNETRVSRKPSTSELLEWVSALIQLGVKKGTPGPQNLRLAADAAPTEDLRANWSELPRLECLVKTPEDRRDLGL